MTKNGSLWDLKGSKYIFIIFLSNCLFLRIFGDFFRFFEPFSTTSLKTGLFGPEFDPFGHISRERDFSRTCDFHRNPKTLMFFRFKQKKVHLNGLDFRQNGKQPCFEAVLGLNP